MVVSFVVMIAGVGDIVRNLPVPTVTPVAGAAPVETLVVTGVTGALVSL